MRCVAVLRQIQNPPRCQRVEDLGAALEAWLSKRRQYEMFTDRDGRPCQASDDSLVAAMFRLMPKSQEETVMFTYEDEGLQELFDWLLTYTSTKQVVKMIENKRQTRRDDPVDADALSKGKAKGKGKKSLVGPGKGNKCPNHMSDVKCWNCGRSGHYCWDCRETWSGHKGSGKSQEGKGGKGKNGKGKVKSKCKGKGKLNSFESSNWQEHVVG